MPQLKKKPATVKGPGRRKSIVAIVQPVLAEELTVEQIALYSALTSENGFSIDDARRHFLGESSTPVTKRPRS
ncbi:hypothetical protein INH39_12160 [Massilia violaceinigra]|uniref:CopG family transcriptional regulator n=1 Tax=Massilia violaceinigra TaxID=2045208 RepID=A0ABY4AC78_9BURK|nr:hypothetical protein [Massilia violaceinigra]UOD32341.1 hypothetical protein INH39_12160 [Massilia violaceinigra]